MNPGAVSSPVTVPPLAETPPGSPVRGGRRCSVPPRSPEPNSFLPTCPIRRVKGNLTEFPELIVPPVPDPLPQAAPVFVRNPRHPPADRSGRRSRQPGKLDACRPRKCSIQAGARSGIDICLCTRPSLVVQANSSDELLVSIYVSPLLVL